MEICSTLEVVLGALVLVRSLLVGGSSSSLSSWVVAVRSTMFLPVAAALALAGARSCGAAGVFSSRPCAWDGESGEGFSAAFSLLVTDIAFGGFSAAFLFLFLD